MFVKLKYDNLQTDMHCTDAVGYIKTFIKDESVTYPQVKVRLKYIPSKIYFTYNFFAVLLITSCDDILRSSPSNYHQNANMSKKSRCKYRLGYSPVDN